ncbi:MAG: FAD-dependent oxidoreductase, partial [Anaerolineales bacterium]|nr:FAD-dependent oxidoreductase [Anaerolineales bacterium]
RVVGVETNQGDFPTAAVVVAAGPWSPQLLQNLGVDLPLITSRVKIGLYRRPDDFKQHRVWGDFVNQIYLRPETGNLTLVGSISADEAQDRVENPDSFNEKVGVDILAEFGERAAQRYPEMTRSNVFGNFASLYDITP